MADAAVVGVAQQLVDLRILGGRITAEESAADGIARLGDRGDKERGQHEDDGEAAGHGETLSPGMDTGVLPEFFTISARIPEYSDRTRVN